MEDTDGRRPVFRIVNALATALESRDLHTAGHHARASSLARRIAQHLALDAHTIEGVRIGAAIHDIGKNGVPFEIIAKPAKLSCEEMAVMRNHVRIGANILAGLAFPWPVLDIVRQHHERLDGSGYPEGLRGEAIRLESRIMAVADTVDAMMAHRPYRKARRLDYVVSELERGRGQGYDPDVVDACIDILRHPDYSHGQ